MNDNTEKVQDYLDGVAERLIAQGRKPSSIYFSVTSRKAHRCMPFDRPYIVIHYAGPGDTSDYFPGDNASECMADCEMWLTKLEAKAA